MYKLVTLLLSILLFGPLLGTTTDTFYHSFIKSYDLSGRYTHEYHPFILKKTRESFLELEQSLRDAHFSVDGRMLIIGYQEEGVPPYTTDWAREALEDEVVVKTVAGVSQPTRNIFGYMTGFLLKDAEWLERFWYKDTKLSYISHILARPIALFDDKAVIFQKHAFGKDFTTLLETRTYIERALYKKDFKGILSELINFWATMYQQVSTTGSQEVVGTQDMLFSIDYARALKEGRTPLRKIFVGPDITYPIEVLSCQKEKATAHAQEFIKVLQQEVRPINNANTAYIFCSFVDGVGKSTLLNNIKNWGKYGIAFDKYDRCDNSSSQTAELYKLQEKVFLVDLPAQISHFTIKPDGQVFVDIQTVKQINPVLQVQLLNYVKHNSQMLTEQFARLTKEVAQEQKALYEDEDPIRQYTLTCHTMNIQEPEWIPFIFEGRYYLFNKVQPERIRILVPLAGVHSMGLKVIEPEHMLFTHGLSLPMQYNAFLDDLKKKLHNAQIKHVVFVDFLSMYPRSSRENIRVNFVLQYLKKIFGDAYSIKDSFYRHHIHKEQEICHVLHTKFQTMLDLVVLETAMRWALYELLENKSADTIALLRGKELEEKIKAKTNILLAHHSSQLLEEARERLEPEQTIYYQKYALDKTYETLVRFSFAPILFFHEVLYSVFTKVLKVPYFDELWYGMEGTFTPVITSAGKVQVRVTLDTGIDAEIRYLVHNQNREVSGLKDIIQGVRAQWYALLAQLLALKMHEGTYVFEKLEHLAPPLILKEGLNGYILAVQKRFPLIDPSSAEGIQLPLKFHIIQTPGKQRRWGLFAKCAHCMDWDNPGTFFALYAYGYNPFKNPKNTITQLVEQYRQKCVKEGKANWGMPTIELYRQIIEQQLMTRIKEEIKSQNQGKITEITPERMPLVRLWIRMIATLDMIMKDMRSEIFIRKGNKEDFIAAIQLLETITLPLFFGLDCKTPLFSDYTAVDPVIPWDKII